MRAGGQAQDKVSVSFPESLCEQAALAGYRDTLAGKPVSASRTMKRHGHEERVKRVEEAAKPLSASSGK